MEPALGTYLTTIADLDGKGQEHRGHANPISQTVQRSGQTALVDSCANTLDSGSWDKKTGERLTQGSARDNLLITLKIAPDGVWKVAGTSYRDTPC
ncbi:hypothetical protein [Fodinicola acaciae]|uniref:hypothetical protein n=1 Tax=Fodinicola acaciae TaxID=2681555 RepID=UPI0013D0009D|nr:hypothetical protein [Fodinicola acaciae]